MSLSRTTVLFTTFVFAGPLLGASAQQPIEQQTRAAVACSAAQRGTVNCPNYTAPATTAVPEASMDGSMNLPAATSTTLFNGTVPPNAFTVQTYNGSATCVVNDHGPANGAGLLVAGASIAGFPIVQPYQNAPIASYITPPGYKPIGPVSVWCQSPTYVTARGW
jgi:hypothetical protein